MGRNCPAEVTVLNLGRFAHFGPGQCPETPQRFLWQASPETPHDFATPHVFLPHFALISLTSRERRGRMPTYLCKKNPLQEKHTNAPSERTKGMTNSNR